MLELYNILTKSSFFSQIVGMFLSKTLLDSPVERQNVGVIFFVLPRVEVGLGSSLKSRVHYSLHHGNDKG